MLLKFHAETPVIKGYNRSCIYDLPRNDYSFYPNEIIDKLKSLEGTHFLLAQNSLDENEKLWLNNLMEKEFCFTIPTQFIDYFPQIDFKWESPSFITNAIIDIDILNIIVDFNLLEKLNCKHIVVRIFNAFELNQLLLLIHEKIGDLTFQSIELMIEKNNSLDKKTFSRLKSIVLKEFCQIISVILFDNKKTIGNVFFRPNFVMNIKVFSESLHHNVYYNRKLYIDSIGNVKNGIETTKILGNIIKNNSLNYFIKKTRENKTMELWNINKDKIDICKDCEFRYMCVDNRTPKKRKENEYYFEDECSYNPYISKWSDDEGYLSLNKSGVYSNKDGFTIDIQKVHEINLKLWNA